MMAIAKRWFHRSSSRVPSAMFLLLGAVLAAGSGLAQPRDKPLPLVVSASAPFYPPIPRQAHIEGVIRLRLLTDGNRVSQIHVESGPPLLVQAAEENVKTWEFKQHTPVTFETTFQYKLLPSKCDSKCNCDDRENGTAHLHLPTEVEVSAKADITCDPTERVH